MGFDYIIEDIEDADIGIYYATSIVKKNRNKIETVKELPNKFKVKSRAEVFVKKEIKKLEGNEIVFEKGSIREIK